MSVDLSFTLTFSLGWRMSRLDWRQQGQVNTFVLSRKAGIVAASGSSVLVEIRPWRSHAPVFASRAASFVSALPRKRLRRTDLQETVVTTGATLEAERLVEGDRDHPRSCR